MKWFLPTLLLFPPPAPDDAQARELYGSLRKAFASADTLSLDLSMTVTVQGFVDGSIAGTLRMKGEKQWSLALQSRSNRRTDMNFSMFLVSDGARVVGQAPGGDKMLEPKAMADRFRRSLPETLIPLMLLLEPRNIAPAIGEVREDEIKDGGSETIDGVKTQILLYGITIEKEKVAVKSWVDPAGPRLVKRELSVAQGNLLITESFSAMALNAPLADEGFRYASRRRLAEARARQLARSVALYGNFTGRTPGAIEDLVTKPRDLPEGILWPAGGFVLGGEIGKDPWGHSFVLRRDRGRLLVVSLGADGKPGGSGDDEDVSAEAPSSARMAVVPPTDRLRKQYEARITMQLVAAATRGYLETYGELPRKKADLLEKPERETVWPDLGWIPGRTMPLDPWGEEFRLITDLQYARVQVQDPKAREVTLRQLTDDEKAGLERAARPVLTDPERVQVDGLVRQLGDDDLDVRQKAHDELRRFGSAVDGALAIHIAAEKDLETKSRLEELRRSLPKVVPPWKAELGPISTGIYAEGRPAVLVANERNVSATLKTLTSAEADFRANDRDWNHVNDFWTGDVAGLYTCKDQAGQSIKLIELSTALADAAPLPAGSAAGKIPALAGFGVPQPKAGYWFRAMETSADVNPPEALKTDTGGTPTMGKVHHTSRFGFCAYPVEYGMTGTRTFIVNENNTLFWKDTSGEAVLEWPSDADLTEWRKLD